MLARGYTPPSLLSLGSTTLRFGAPRTGSKTPPVGDCSARGCCGTTKRLRPTSKRPTAQTRSNVMSIHVWSAFHRLGSVITAYHDETWWVVQVVGDSHVMLHAAPSVPKFKNADTDTSGGQLYVYKSCYSLLVWVSNQNIDWWHWLVACCPHTTQPTTQASPPTQGNYHQFVIGSPEVNLRRSRNLSRHTVSWRARPTIVHHRLSAPRPWTRTYRHTRYTIPNFTHY